jgi:hypothetical protein
MPKRRHLAVAFFLGAGLPAAACSTGDVARPAANDAASVRGNASDAGNPGESETSFEAGGTCNSCSVDTDCRTYCAPPALRGYVWCCGYGTCFNWANACPPLSVDGGNASDGGPLDSGSDAPPDDGGLLNATTDCQPAGAHGGHRWQDLYACYFGPTGNVSCGSAAGCHSQSSDQGSIASNFVCNPTSDACWQSLTTSIVAPDAASDPTMARLYSVLCKSDGSGAMPQGCPTRLLTGDLARVAAWIQAGAPND